MEVWRRARSYKKEIILGVVWALLAWITLFSGVVWDSPFLFNNPLVAVITLPILASGILLFLLLEIGSMLFSPLEILLIIIIVPLIYVFPFLVGIVIVILASVAKERYWNEVISRKKWIALGAVWGLVSLLSAVKYHLSEGNLLLKLVSFVLIIPYNVSTIFFTLIEGLNIELLEGTPGGIHIFPIIWFGFILPVLFGAFIGFFASKIINKLREGH